MYIICNSNNNNNFNFNLLFQVIRIPTTYSVDMTKESKKETALKGAVLSCSSITRTTFDFIKDWRNNFQYFEQTVLSPTKPNWDEDV